MFLLSAKKSIKKQYIFPCICKIDMMNFIRNIIGEKIAHQSLQETIIGLLYGIMQVTYEDHGAKIAKYFQKKLIELMKSTSVHVYIYSIHKIFVLIIIN